jgi:hypothetical protein
VGGSGFRSGTDHEATIVVLSPDLPALPLLPFAMALQQRRRRRIEIDNPRLVALR